MEVQALFRSLDEPFLNFTEKNDPITWKGSKIHVTQSFEVKIPTTSGCIVKYTFDTIGGDIEFNTVFDKPGGETEVGPIN